MADFKFVFLNALTMFKVFLEALIFVRILLSWIPPLQRSAIGRFVYMLSEPILSPIRQLVARSPFGGPGMILDFSPIIAYFLINFCYSVLYSFTSSF